MKEHTGTVGYHAGTEQPTEGDEEGGGYCKGQAPESNTGDARAYGWTGVRTFSAGASP